MSYLTKNYPQRTIAEFAEAAYSVKDAINPVELIDFLFDVQNELIKGDYWECMDGKEKSYTAYKLLVLRDFVKTISNISDSKEVEAIN